MHIKCLAEINGLQLNGPVQSRVQVIASATWPTKHHRPAVGLNTLWPTTIRSSGLCIQVVVVAAAAWASEAMANLFPFAINMQIEFNCSQDCNISPPFPIPLTGCTEFWDLLSVITECGQFWLDLAHRWSPSAHIRANYIATDLKDSFSSIPGIETYICFQTAVAFDRFTTEIVKFKTRLYCIFKLIIWSFKKDFNYVMNFIGESESHFIFLLIFGGLLRNYCKYSL